MHYIAAHAITINEVNESASKAADQVMMMIGFVIIFLNFIWI